MKFDAHAFDPINTAPRLAAWREQLADAEVLFAFNGPISVEAARHRAEIVTKQDLLTLADQVSDAAERACGVGQTRH